MVFQCNLKLTLMSSSSIWYSDSKSVESKGSPVILFDPLGNNSTVNLNAATMSPAKDKTIVLF